MIRFFLVLIEILLFFLLQSTVMPAFALAGTVPDLLLILVLTVAYTRGRTAGMLTGLLTGLLTDLCFNKVVGVCALISLTIGYFAGYSNKIYEEKDYFFPMILMAVGEFLYSFAYFVVYFLLRSRTQFGFYFFHLILPRMVYTVFAAALLYPLLHWIHRLLLRLEQRGDS